MSLFGQVLEDEMKTQNVSALELASRMGIGDSLISGFINNRRTGCNVKTLMQMVSGISDDPAVQARLLEAYFRDQCLTRYKPWVSVDPEGPSSILREEPARYSAPRTPDPESALLAKLRALHLPHKVLESLMDIARFIPGRHKFRVVIEDLGSFAREEMKAAK